MTVIMFYNTAPISYAVTEMSTYTVEFSANNKLYNEIIDGRRWPLFLRSITLCGANSATNILLAIVSPNMHSNKVIF